MQGWNLKRNWPLHFMLAPSLVILLIYQYGPMAGLVMAFQDYKPWLGIRGSVWVGLDHFRMFFDYPEIMRVFWNTLIIASLKIAVNFITPFVFAILLNEVRHTFFKRSVQTLVYLPHFLSWVILGGIMVDMLSPEGGLLNQVLESTFGIRPIFFLGDPDWFRFVVVISDTWKDFGFAAIIFLAALAGIDPGLYEASVMDGANRWKQTLYVTVPSMLPIAVVVLTLSLGQVLDAGFDQIFNLYNPLVYETGDIIDTFVYRTGLLSGQFSFATAVGLFKSAVSFIMVVISYLLAYKLANYRIF
ncbi:ABC transporter permease subunit [Paenibacillus sp. HB172176]|uniref:ABC transporter permease n=1 Tax=Paenibacillus sp. HB172176 TaxID=2493690 RepID=UPI00143A4E4C|nr:ABC transporter permease subunit [Paenibacillus sp. HB172176]